MVTITKREIDSNKETTLTIDTKKIRMLENVNFVLGGVKQAFNLLVASGVMIFFLFLYELHNGTQNIKLGGNSKQLIEALSKQTITLLSLIWITYSIFSLVKDLYKEILGRGTQKSMKEYSLNLVGVVIGMPFMAVSVKTVNIIPAGIAVLRSVAISLVIDFVIKREAEKKAEKIFTKITQNEQLKYK